LKKTAESSVKNKRALRPARSKKIVTKSHFKPIIEPLQKIVDNSSMRAIKDEPHDDDVKMFIQKDIIRNKMKMKREDTSIDHALSQSHKLMRYTSNDVMDSPAITSTPRTTIEAANPIKDEDVFETTNDSFTTSVQH